VPVRVPLVAPLIVYEALFVPVVVVVVAVAVAVAPELGVTVPVLVAAVLEFVDVRASELFVFALSDVIAFHHSPFVFGGPSNNHMQFVQLGKHHELLYSYSYLDEPAKQAFYIVA
jgi:hypothetical protein